MIVMPNAAGIMVNSLPLPLPLPHKAEHRIPHDPAIPLVGIHTKELKEET